MERHIKALGLLHVAYGVMGIASMYGVAYLTRHLGLAGINRHYLIGNGVYIGGDSFHVLHLIGLSMMAAMVILGLAEIIGGCGLLGRKNWGRILVFVLGIIALLNFPFGTALGIYTLIVLLKPEVREYMTA